MASEPLSKRAKTSKDATSPTVSVGGVIFTPELIARITTFADAISYPDVMNICLAVGPVVSRTIKHFYLRQNKEYLIDTLKSVAGFYYGASKAGTNHRAWMEVNADWKTTAVSDDSISEIHELILSRTIMDGSRPFIAFNSTVFAVELGLLEVVKFLIEDKGVDPNEYVCGWTFQPHDNYRVHLVSAAMTFEQEAIFKYLLSLPSTNLYAEIDNIRNDGLFEQALGIYVGDKKEKAYLTSIINHTRFDVNRACHRYSTFPTSNISCLFMALEKVENCLGGFEERYGPSGNEDPDLTQADSESLERHVNVIKLLLEAGANPNQNVLVVIGSSIDLVGRWLRELHPNVGYPSIRLLRERVFRQLLTMMREAKLPEARAMPLLQQSNIDL